jgi:hypothetical protein
MIGLVILLIAFNAHVVASPTPASLAMIVLSTVGAYAVLAGIAQWLDRQRVPVGAGNGIRTARGRTA